MRDAKIYPPAKAKRRAGNQIKIWINFAKGGEKKVKTLKKIGKIAMPLVLISIFALSFGVALAYNKWSAPGQPQGVPNNLENALINVTNWILGFVALIAVLIIIWGGVQYLTAAGNEDTVATAKKTITWGIMGLVICGLAYAIVYVVTMYWLAA